MTLTATIKDTGDDVTCICETDGNRKTFRVTLKDFIDSISSTETQETIYYDPIRYIPDEVISFRLAKNRSLFSAKVIIQKKAGMCFFNYGGNVFNIPMPTLLFELYIKDQMVDTKKTKIYALNSKMEICAYPYTNVQDALKQSFVYVLSKSLLFSAAKKKSRIFVLSAKPLTFGIFNEPQQIRQSSCTLVYG